MCPSVDEDGGELGFEILLVTELINDPGLEREKLYIIGRFSTKWRLKPFPRHF